METKEMKRREWIKGRTVGRGAFGVVCVAASCNYRRFPPVFAIKSSTNPRSIASLQNEGDVLSRLPPSPYIVRCFGAEQSKGEEDILGQDSDIYHLFLEYVDGGSLMDRVRKEKLDELAVRFCTGQILQGLRHIHSHGFVHCDIKPHNVLFNPSSRVIKISDFGLARRTEGRLENSDDAAPGKRSFIGTPMYAAPEVARCELPEAASDIWSLGCTVIELITGKPPWIVPGSAHFASLLYRIQTEHELPGIPSELSEEGKDFLSRCLDRDPRQRWSAEMLLQHDFVKNISNYESSFTPSTSDTIGTGCMQRAVINSSSPNVDVYAR